MSEVTRADVDEILKLLRNFPADGQLFTGERSPDRDMAALKANALGLIELKSEDRRCSQCGAKRIGHQWHAISPAGRALLAFADKEKA